MRKTKFLLLFTLMVTLLAACSSDSDDTAVEVVTINCSPTTIDAPAQGGTYALSVSCTGREWTAFSDDREWIAVSVSGSTSSQGTVSVTLKPNTSYSQRMGTVVVSSGTTARQVVSVTQAAAPEPEKPAQPEADNEVRVPEGYQLVWHDEFDEGTSPRTGSQGWWYETGATGWGNHELQNYVNGTSNPKVCFLESGFLNIVLQKVGSEVRSIRMNTSQAWQYGWFEARLRLPVGKGTWPAFWMMPQHFTAWPADGEIDIMEEVGYNPNYVLATIHCNKYNNGGTSVESAGRKVATAQTDFHIYACEWTDTFLRFYIDGEPLLTYNNDGTGRDAWPFDAPFYLKLNLAWGGDWGGAQGTDETCLPATYQIDYVRVFQKR